MDIYGLLLLIVVLIVVSALQTAAFLGVLFALPRLAADRFPDSTIGTLDLQNIQNGPLSEFLSRLGAVVFATTVLLHLFEFFLVGVFIKRHPGLVCVTLLVLQTASLGAGFRYFLKLDPRRTAILTGCAGVLYLVLFWAVIYGCLQ